MKKVKTGIIGCGKVGHFHAKAYCNLDSSAFTAVYDSDINRSESFAKTYNVKAFSSIRDMIDETGVDVISICTPHPLHAAAAVEAVENGANILVEKPLASSLEDCDKILKAAKSRNVTVGTVCQRRFYEPSMRIRRAIDDNKLGKPILATVNMLGWRDKEYYESDRWRGTWKGEGGGVLVNQAPHQLDLLHWYMGPIDEVFAYWGNLNHPYIEVEDTAIALLKFRNGGLGTILVSNSQNPALYGKVHVHGENGASVGIQTDGGAMFVAGMSSIMEPPVNDLWTIPGEEGNLEKWREEDTAFFNSIDSLYYYHERQIENYINAVISGENPLIDGEEGRKTVEIFTAIYRSNRDRKPVKFPLEIEESDDFDGRQNIRII